MRVGKVNQWVQPNQTKHFHGIQLKPMQIAIIKCNKVNSVIVNLPTGFGKSLLFQYPAHTLVNKCIIVFVPLKALLWDCLKEAQIFKISATQLDSAFIRDYTKDQNLPKLLFLTPQRLFSNNGVLSFVDMLSYRKMIEMIVIDQAHCISQWGSDFRPDYEKICNIKSMFGDCRILGMSATIPPEARLDLIKKLHIQGCYYFQSSSNRPNLIYQVQKIKKSQISNIIKSYLKQNQLIDKPGIIYCQTIKQAQETYKQLRKSQINCCLFHSKLKQKTREQCFSNFMSEKVKIIVATICFGMGVNKKNIRYVINVGVSLSPQNYYQQSGRAGRDGQIAHCLLLTHSDDMKALQFLIGKSSSGKSAINRKLFKLRQIKQYTQATQCRKMHLFKILGEEFTPQQCQKTCDFCIRGKQAQYQMMDFTQVSQQILSNYSLMKLNMTKRQLVQLLKGKQMKKGKRKYSNIQKQKSLLGLLKNNDIFIIEKLIQTLIKQNYFVPQIVKTKFHTYQTLKTCKKMLIKANRKIFIKIIKGQRENKQNIDKNTLHKTFNERFSKYLQKKSISQSFDKECVLDKVQRKKQNKKEQQLDEIKMVTMTNQYQYFLQEMFNDDNNNNATISLTEDQEDIIYQQVGQDYLASIIDDQLQTPFNQDKNNNYQQKYVEKLPISLQKKKQIQTDQQNQINNFLFRKKQQLKKKQQAIKRKKIASLQFL